MKLALASDLHFEFHRDGGVALTADLPEADILLCPGDLSNAAGIWDALLLLLESQPVYNEPLYEELLERVIESYYRDYHDHERTFRPIFLINDIIRFWRTLCLNYENRRNRPPEDGREQHKFHLDNFKLKFSRLLTCFSAIILLAKNN